jgi:membrane protein implicated in regulation of membrane protease activity
MPWWGWVTIGAMLLIAEVSFVDLEFYLIFLGISALLVGALDLAGVAMPFWMQWVVFAVLAVASLVIFRQRVYTKLRPPPEGEVQIGVSGDRAIAVDSIEPGATGSVTLRGTNWTGLNRGSVTIPAGARCRVERSEGLVLDLRLED